MLLYENVTYDELIIFAEYVIKKYSTKKEEDLIQLSKFKEILKTKQSENNWHYFIEGWIKGLEDKYHYSIENFLRKEKIKKING